MRRASSVLSSKDNAKLKKLALAADPDLVFVSIQAKVINSPDDLSLVETDFGPAVGIRTNPGVKSRHHKFYGFVPGSKEMALHCRKILD